jgi:hypothetical protein
VSFPEDKIVLGRYLGPAIDIGPMVTRKILKRNGSVLYRSTVRSEEIRARASFDAAIQQRLGEPTAWVELTADPDYETPVFEAYEDASGGSVEQAQDAHDTFDQYVGAEVLLSTGDRMMTGKVTGRKRDRDGVPRGMANANSILDTRVYTVEFPDGEIGEYAANAIAENMYSQCDSEGKQFRLLEAIVDHRKDGHAVEEADMYV